MTMFDPEKLLEDVDPAFRSAAADEFGRLMQEAEAMASATLDERVGQYGRALRLLAATLYVIARDLNLPPQDMSVVAIYVVGLFTGSSCNERPQTLEDMKRLFGAALEDASRDKGRSAAYMADIVGEGIDIIRGIQPPDPKPPPG